MIHWGFLILTSIFTFIGGFILCYYIIYQCAKVYGRVMEAVEQAGKYF